MTVNIQISGYFVEFYTLNCGEYEERYVTYYEAILSVWQVPKFPEEHTISNLG